MATSSPALTASRVINSTTLPRMVADTPIGKTTNIDVLRKGRKQTFRITVAKLADDAKPDKPGAKLPPPLPKPKSKVSQVGLTLGLLDGTGRAKFRLSGRRARACW